MGDPSIACAWQHAEEYVRPCGETGFEKGEFHVELTVCSGEWCLGTEMDVNGDAESPVTLLICKLRSTHIHTRTHSSTHLKINDSDDGY